MEGILIIALGHPNYGKMALQLAVSLKNTCPKIPIALAYNESAISHIHRFNPHNYIDHFIPVPMEYYTRNGNTEYVRAKLFMYEITPFEKTLFLDCDIIAFPPRSFADLFHELKDIPLAMQNRGRIDMSEAEPKGSVPWVKPADVKQMYRISKGWYYKIHSELVWFTKCDANEKLFADAIYLYDNLEVEVLKPFAGGIPDELPLSISMILNNHYPHTSPFTPLFWGALEKEKRNELHELYDDYYAFSIGGNISSTQTIERYTKLAKWHCNKAGIRQIYFYQHKKNWLAERINI